MNENKFLVESIIGLLLFGIVITCLIWYGMTVYEVYVKLDKAAELYKNMVGKQVIIKSDTLDIVDYSYMKENLTLSNGLIVDYEYAKNHLID
jgi:hypothetical protein